MNWLSSSGNMQKLWTYASAAEKLPKKLSCEFQQFTHSTPHLYGPVFQLWGLCSREDRVTTHHGSPCGFICMHSERTWGKPTSALEGHVCALQECSELGGKLARGHCFGTGWTSFSGWWAIALCTTCFAYSDSPSIIIINNKNNNNNNNTIIIIISVTIIIPFFSVLLNCLYLNQWIWPFFPQFSSPFQWQGSVSKQLCGVQLPATLNHNNNLISVPTLKIFPSLWT